MESNVIQHRGYEISKHGIKEFHVYDVWDIFEESFGSVEEAKQFIDKIEGEK